MKKGNETITKEERRRRFDEAMTSIQTKFIVEAEEAAPENVKPHREAPAWLRPVAACLAVLILGGLVVFSIPVVNNIISRRGPAELPGTDVAEADTKEEETEKKEETEEIEEPVEQNSIYDQKYTRGIIFEDGKCYQLRASFNDLLNSPFRVGVSTAEQAAKVTKEMDMDEIREVLGCRGNIDAWFNRDFDIERWALDNGEVFAVRLKYDHAYANYAVYRGIWDSVEDNPVQIIGYDDKSVWKDVVLGDVFETAQQYYQNVDPGKMPAGVEASEISTQTAAELLSLNTSVDFEIVNLPYCPEANASFHDIVDDECRAGVIHASELAKISTDMTFIEIYSVLGRGYDANDYGWKPTYWAMDNGEVLQITRKHTQESIWDIVCGYDYENNRVMDSGWDRETLERVEYETILKYTPEVGTINIIDDPVLWNTIVQYSLEKTAENYFNIHGTLPSWG